MAQLPSVLLVDDDPTTNFVNELLLKNMGVAKHLLIAENGAEALHILAQNCVAPNTATCPALILLDINMPVMNGLAFLEAFQQLPLAQQRAIVIVMLTTSVNPHNLARAQKLPVAGFLTKPLTKEKMAALLHQHFPSSRL